MGNKSFLFSTLVVFFGISTVFAPTEEEIIKICKNLEYPKRQLNPFVGFALFGFCLANNPQNIIEISLSKDKDHQDFQKRRRLLFVLRRLDKKTLWNCDQVPAQEVLEKNLEILICCFCQTLGQEIIDRPESLDDANFLAVEGKFSDFLRGNFRNVSEAEFISQKIKLLTQIIKIMIPESEADQRIKSFYTNIINNRVDRAAICALQATALLAQLEKQEKQHQRQETRARKACCIM